MSTQESSVNNTYLSEEELDHFRQRLHDEKEEAEKRIEELQSSIEEIEQKLDDNTSGSAHHQGDLGSGEEIRETNYTLIEKQKDKLEQIAAALDRIETGNYGTCIVTGEPIQKERLEYMPYALHSVEAKQGNIEPERRDQLSVNETDKTDSE